MKPDKCPRCGSCDIGELGDIEGELSEEEYEKAGGRYYCVACGWTQPSIEEQDAEYEIRQAEAEAEAMAKAEEEAEERARQDEEEEQAWREGRPPF